MAALATVVGLCLAGGGYFVALLILRWRDWTAPKYSRALLLRVFALLWSLAALQLGYVRFVENRPLDSIGLEPVPPLVFAFGVVVGFLLLAVLSAIPEGILQQFGRALPDESGLFLLAQPPHWKLAVALTAGVPEAILFYGYLIERVIELTGNPLWAVGLSTVLAARASLPRRAEIRVERIPLAVGSALAPAILYLWFRNVLVVAGATTLTSALVLLMNAPEDALFGRELSDLDDRVARAIRNS